MTDKDRKPEEQADSAQRPDPPAQATPPRGNPERDQESVEKGEEQLDKIAGN
ncbi:MAG: hypothetical protein QOF83_589 [Solirubrobacteraceae bacterium]|jgi:hypothetical protein|nr:hypothetical protein [Solirubrobacteraceae bacterium]